MEIPVQNIQQGDRHRYPKSARARKRCFNLGSRAVLALIAAGVSIYSGGCTVCRDQNGCSNLAAIRQRCDDACGWGGVAPGSDSLSCEACQKMQQDSGTY